MNFNDLREKRLNYLSSNRCRDNDNTISSTKFGKEVFVSKNYSSGVLEIFEINNVFENERRSMMIGWEKYDNDVKICDIQGTQNLGYGSLGLSLLIEWCKHEGIRRIYGDLSVHDLGHKDRLLHFYAKHGFSIHYDNIENENFWGRIELKLKR